MDRTGKLILAASVILLVVSFVYRPELPERPAPNPLGEGNATRSDLNRTDANRTDRNATISAPPDGNATDQNQTPPPVAPQVAPPKVETPEKTIVLTNANARYTFTTKGGGVAKVELIERDADGHLKFPEAIGDQDANATPIAMNLDRGRLPLLALQPADATVDYGPVGKRPYQEAPVEYTVVDSNKTSVTMRATGVTANNIPGWVVEKKFTLGEGYQLEASVTVSQSVQGTAGQSVFYLVSGTAKEPLNGSQMMGLGYGMMLMAGGESDSIMGNWFDNYRMGCQCFGSNGARNNYRAGQNNVQWVGAYSDRYFIQAVIPSPEQPGSVVNINRFRLNALSQSEAIAAGKKLTDNQYAFETALAVSLNAGESRTFTYTLYTGPREYDRLRDIGIAKGGNRFHEIMDFGWFGWVAEPLLRIMNWFEPKLSFLKDATVSGYAMAIIAITLLIKLIFWPLTARSTRAMKKMAKVNAKMMPEIQKLRERYKNDYQKMNLKMMEVYKKYGVNPLSQMGGCLPMVIQIPIFIGFFTMLRSAVELRGSEFLWVTDLSSPDTIASIAGFPINIMPLLMTGTMFLQMRLQPPAPTMDATQQAVMKYMPLMFIFFLYSASAGLCLYWTLNNILSIIQTKLTKVEEDEDTEGAVEVIPPKTKKRKS